MGNYLRSKKTEQRYEKSKARGFLINGCPLCKENKIIKKFKYWRILKNKFPHDYLAKIDHMIVPERHIIYGKLSKIEKKEFEKIKSNYIEKKYEITLEATNRKKSIPQHFHVHLIVLRKRS